jgi:putative ABC transport system permease protein
MPREKIGRNCPSQLVVQSRIDRLVSVEISMRFLMSELRFAGRLLLRKPGFAALGILTLGIAIGACTLIYSIVYGVALRPLPYPHPEAIVRLNQLNEKAERTPFSDPNFEDLKAQTTSFAAMAEYSPGTTSVMAGTTAVRSGASTVSRDFFDVLATVPARGRTFAAEELREGSARVAIVSQRFWQTHFSDLKALTDARLAVNGDPYTVVGVMPAGFDFPPGADVWTPREARPRNPFRTGHNWAVIARIHGGITLAAARVDATTVAHRLKQEYGSDTYMTDVAIVPLQEDLVGSVKPLLFLLLTTVVFLLIVACANLANMLLARSAARRREMATRAALGATGASLFVPLMAESFIVAALGGLAGIVLAYAGVRGISLAGIGNLPRVAEIRLSWEVIVLTTGITCMAALVLGVVSAWHARAADLAESLKEAQRSHTGGQSFRFLRSGLVIVQLAVSLVLLIGAGLLGRSFVTLLSQDLGFRRGQLLTIDLSRRGPTVRATPERVEFDDPSSLTRQAQFNERLLQRLQAIPGIVEAGGVTGFPMGAAGSSGTFIIARGSDRFLTIQDLLAFNKLPERTGYASYRVASGGYFPAMGIPLVRGRVFDARDVADAPHVAVISESLARTRWPEQDPIGQQIQFGGMDGDLRLFTIVGIVGDVKERGLDSEPSPTFYADYRQRPLSTFNFTVVLQTRADPASVAAEARRTIQEMAPDVPPRIRTVGEVISASVANRRLTFLLTGSFAFAALSLAVLGIYSVLSYLVSQRYREIGVRMALGATRSDVRRLILREAARLVSVGVLLGILAALAMSRILNGMLFRITPTDPTTYAAVACVIALAAFVASEIPAIRATRVDPMHALRSE